MARHTVFLEFPGKKDTMLLADRLIGAGITLKQFKPGTEYQMFIDRENRRIRIEVGQGKRTEGTLGDILLGFQ